MAKRKESQAKVSKQQQTINGEALRSAVSRVADIKVFEDLKKHGNTSWMAADLIRLAVLWVWSEKSTATAAFEAAKDWSTNVTGAAAVSTYQGLMKALVRWTPTWLPLLWCRMRELMRQQDAHWRVGLWMAVAVDGSRISVPRTKANEKAYCAPDFGRGKTAKYRKKKGKGKRRRKTTKEKMQPIKPQMWITLMWHMGLQMPWGWRTGPSNSSERGHFQEILEEEKFPENTLFCADAGFTGYDLWKAILDKRHSFLIRVGKNVTLLRKLGYARERDGIVYFWPAKAARKKQPPLVLRLLHLRLGATDIYLITNILTKKRLSDQQAIKLYKLRWGVELQFRSLKQTFDRRKLLSRDPDRAKVELDWALVGLWMIQLFAVNEQIKIGLAPERCSVALAIKVVRKVAQQWHQDPDRNNTLSAQLRMATKDEYHRKKPKKARYQPNYKDKPSAGKPNIVTAKKRHKQMLKLHLSCAA